MRARALHVITGLATGGAERTLLRLLESAAEHERHGTVVVSLGDRGDLGDAIAALGVRVECLGMSPRWPSIRALGRLARLVRELDPEVLHGWMYHGNAAASAAWIWTGRGRAIAWNVRHGIHDLRREKWSTAAVVRLGARLPAPQRIVYNSHAAAEQHERMGYPAEATLVVANGFDLEAFRPSERARARLRRELGLSDAALVVGLVARLHPVKDHAGFLAAAARADPRSADVHFVLAGRGVEPARAPFAAWLEREELRGRLHLLGQRADVAELTAGFDVATCCSWSESLPNAVGEAMACAVPCVVTDVGDSRELVGETGRVVVPRDPAALARAWRELLDGGPALRRRLGEAARARIASRYSLQRMVERYAELERELRDALPRRLQAVAGGA